MTPLQRRTPLARPDHPTLRRTPLPRAATGLSRGSGLNPRSAKRVAEDEGPYREAKAAAWARDGGRCQAQVRGYPHVCGGRLDPHHIHPVGELGARCSVDNLLTLCQGAHQPAHSGDRVRAATYGLITRGDAG